MKNYFIRHTQVLFETLGRLCQSPLPTIMTMTVLGIAMALPLLLYQMVAALDKYSERWDGRPHISVFLTNISDDRSSDDRSDESAIQFGQQLLQKPGIEDIQYISPEQALVEFRETSDLGSVLDELDDNPLPPLLVIYPAIDMEEQQISELVTELQSMDNVESAVFDQLWLNRLAAIVSLAQTVIGILSGLMGVGVLLIISNTVRVSISHRNQEIEIIDQVGGTRAFIRRPFLYLGILQGVSSALLAYVIANVGLLLMRAPLQDLSSLYDTQLQIDWVSVKMLGGILLVSGFLGWLAARISVRHALRMLDPSVRGK